MPVVYKNRTGMKLPIKSQIYDGIVAALDPIINTDKSEAATDVGPVFGSVRRLPTEFTNLRVQTDKGDYRWIDGYGPKDAPALAIFVGDTKFEPVSGQNEDRVFQTISVHIYFSSKGYSIKSVLTQPETQTATTEDPGLDVLEELIQDHLYENGILVGDPIDPEDTPMDVIPEFQTSSVIGPVGSTWWMELNITFEMEFIRCPDNTFQPVDCVVIQHFVPSDEVGYIAEQGGTLTP